MMVGEGTPVAVQESLDMGLEPTTPLMFSGVVRKLGKAEQEVGE